MITEQENFLKFANGFADLSGEILTKNFLKHRLTHSKSDGSFVTEIDNLIEEKFIKQVKKKYPSHGIIGEEFGEYNVGAKYVWVIDPLDGTHNFISGKPLFGTLICLLIDGIPSIGVLDVPKLSERWFGGRKLGVKKNEDLCLLKKKNKNLNQSIVSSTTLMMFDDEHFARIRRIYNKSQFPIFGTDCYAYGLLLSGQIDLIIEANMKPWDYLAQVSLINEIGGIISDWSGNKLNLYSNGQIIASTSRKCYEEALEILST
tara:strand:- start:3816 stop:4595 length:780 start_codon:yes stop_codon:yes gene_type:complete